jgi:ATP-dependent protease Clp ATPase subunit
MISKDIMSTAACSFCRKTQDEVMQLIAAPPAHICDECAMLAVEMISIEHPDWRERLMRTLALLPKGPGEKN